MARLRVPYLIHKPGRGGTTRWFWQPSAALRAQGCDSVRLTGADPVAEARALNVRVAAWRAGTGPHPFRPETAAPAGAGGTGTVNALIARYQASRFWSRLAPKSRDTYTKCLRSIARWSGDAPVAAITSPLVQRFYESMSAATPSLAVLVVRVGSILWQYGVREQLCTDNPWRRPGIAHQSAKGRLWPAEAVDHMVATADRLGRRSIGTAVRLNAWLGQREGDILRLTWAAYRDGALHIVQRKTGAAVELPVAMVPALRQRLEDEAQRRAGRQVASLTILVSETSGRAYTESAFRDAFVAVRDAAATTRPDLDLTGLHFRCLRHTAITRMAEAGCEIPQIAAVSGHSLGTVHAIIDRYLVRTAPLARAAFGRRMAAESGAHAPAAGEQTKT